MSLVSANKTETNTMSIEIAVSAEDFKAAVQRSYLKNRKQITIPGFRKGKAPRPMIEKMYGSDFFYEDALEEDMEAGLDHGPYSYIVTFEYDGEQMVNSDDFDFYEEFKDLPVKSITFERIGDISMMD